jgi:hypothetical protein
MRRNTFLSGLALAAFALVPMAEAGDKKEVKPFNGLDLKGWKLKGPEKKSQWIVGRAALNEKSPAQFDATPIPPQADGGPAARLLINAKGQGVDIYTEDKWGDVKLEIEFMVPKGSNSGIYVMGEYEVQILDSFGKKTLTGGDLGALYGAAPPKVNASKAPGEWQTFIIEFKAPRFEDKKKVSNAKFLKVTLNGQVLHENVEMKGPTPSGVTGKEAATGPLMFQGDHGPVAFRRIVVTPMDYSRN